MKMTLDQILDRTGYEGDRDDATAVLAHLRSVRGFRKRRLAKEAIHRITR